ncbi:MAG: hypothetical protein A2Z88_10740 [Omnitrophica WOR_2 bacterium GWA2_47_8]|nr:MAG: hypothetical protein A2Z88_10740 [Omnitrophica WOR_2 bacterium GWA2_47_8]
MNPFDWTCPFCQKPTTIVEERISLRKNAFTIPNKHGDKLLIATFIVCPNNECKQYTLVATLFDCAYSELKKDYLPQKIIKRWDMVPSSKARIYPSGIVPEAILKDYAEACDIVNLSPKAAATIARRCLQGMINDFWGIKNGRLVDQINAIRTLVATEDWEAIDATRQVGNIGAHMEKDVNVIIDVEPDEAEALINLIEILIEDWYIARDKRQKSLSRVKEIAEGKDKKRKELLNKVSSN